VNDCVGNALENPGFEPAPQLLQPFAVFFTLGDCELRGASKSDGRGDVLRPGSTSTLLCSSMHQRIDRYSAPYEHCADALRSSELVTGDGEKIELLRPRIDGNLAEGLHRIGVNESAPLLRFGGQLRQRLNGTDFVVHPHHRAEGNLFIHQTVE
jgi:hypothetical protein